MTDAFHTANDGGEPVGLPAVTEFSKGSQAGDLASSWLTAWMAGDSAHDSHLNLLAWTADHPHAVLAIILRLLDEVEDDEALEAIALGPVEWLFTRCDDHFVPLLREAVAEHPTLALCTRWMRDHSDLPAWRRFRRE